MREKKKWMMAAAAVVGAVTGRICYECRHFTTEYYDVTSDKIPEAFEGFRFVVLTDLHNYDFDHGNRKLLAQIEHLKPDAVMIAGDMIDAHPGADMSVAIRMMRMLCDRGPVYFGNGNHEQRIELYPETYGDMNERWCKAIRHPNLHLLRNQHLNICKDGEEICVYGLELNRKYYKRFRKVPMTRHYMTEKLGICDRNRFNLLLAHNPFYFDEYAKWGADLVLSGHVHGGVVILPFLGGVLSPQVRLFPKYYAGEYFRDSSEMILSRGLHMHSFRIRLLNMPELSCVTLRRS